MVAFDKNGKALAGKISKILVDGKVLTKADVLKLLEKKS